jgi:hypothetical protein
MPPAEYHLDHRPQPYTGRGELRTTNSSNTNTPLTNQHLTYAAAATHAPPTTTLYKPSTFHTVIKNNTYSYPYEDIPHLLITGRYSRATSPKNEFVFKHIFEKG